MLVDKVLVISLGLSIALASGVAFASTHGDGKPTVDLQRESQDPDVVTFGAMLAPVLALTDICSRDSDLVGCETGRGFLALELLAQFHLARHISLGPYLVGGVEAADRGTVASTSTGGTESVSVSSQFGSFGADLRYLPAGPRSFWMGARLGVLAVRDEHAVHTGAGFQKSADYTWAPSLGAGVGYDIGLSTLLALSLTLRGDYVMFRPSDGLPEDGSTEWHPGGWAALGVGILFDL